MSRTPHFTKPLKPIIFSHTHFVDAGLKLSGKCRKAVRIGLEANRYDQLAEMQKKNKFELLPVDG